MASSVATSGVHGRFADARFTAEAAEGFRGRLKRPANGDAVGMAEFDHTLGELFREVLQRVVRDDVRREAAGLEGRPAHGQARR